MTFFETQLVVGISSVGTQRIKEDGHWCTGIEAAESWASKIWTKLLTLKFWFFDREKAGSDGSLSEVVHGLELGNVGNLSDFSKAATAFSMCMISSSRS